VTQLKLAVVLRIWEESGLAEMEQSILRGSLHRVDTDDIRYFADLKQVEVVLQEWVQGQREKHNTERRK